MEPNDTLLTAAPTNINAGDTGEFIFSGVIGDNPDLAFGDDVDLFEVELSGNAGVFFDIDANEFGSFLDPILRLFDADGNELAVNDDSDGLDSFIGFNPPSTGTYYVGVSGYSNFDYDPTVPGSGSGFNSTGFYDLIITTGIAIEPGLSGGAKLVKDINPGIVPSYPFSSFPDNLTEFNGQLFFTANDGVNGNELWVNNGTLTGTQLLADINSGSSYYYSYSSGSYASNLTEANGLLFFTANDGFTGNELWVSDGTTAGTQLLLDINPTGSYYGYYGYYSYPSGSYANNLTEANGLLFFTANDGVNGNELWVSDGTTAGTQMLKDINPGSSYYYSYYGGYYSYPYGSYASNLTEVNGLLFFTANDGVNGNELWVSDGTTAGTQLLKDINPSSSYYYGYYGGYYSYPSGSYAGNLTEVNGLLFFTANDGVNGNELWVSDGTTAGTQLLKDINPSSSYYYGYYGGYYSYPSGSYAGNLTEVNGLLFFTANDGVNGNELWVSDGTTAGTQLLKDINPSSSYYYGYYGGYYSYPSSSYASNLTEVNGLLFFTANDGVNGNELWVSDGTTAGTQMLKDINPGSSYYYGYYGGYYSYPFGSYASNLTELNGLLFFTANDGVNGNELWVSDGTPGGTKLLKDINPGSSSYGYPSGSYPYNLTAVGGQLFFTANDGVNGNELWVSDGTTAGTQLLADINASSSPSYPLSSYPYNLTEFDGQLFFSADDGGTGRELWVSDGTTAGTQLILDINPGSSYYYGYSSGSYPNNLTEFDGQLFFTANDGFSGNELWVSDGTTAGTQLLLDINPGGSYYGYYGYYSYPSGSYANNLTEANGLLFFTANDGFNGRELWVTDGTTAGTQLVKDINSGSSYYYYYGSSTGSYPSDLTEFDGQLFFTANDGVTGNELWVSDGTTAGTQLLKDINPSGSYYYGYYGYYSYPAGSYAGNLTESGGLLFFTANDGVTGNELWVSDGTTAGTQLLKDINPGSSSYYGYYGGYYSYPAGSYAGNLTDVGGLLFFTANDGVNGNELWVSDGTTAGTQLLKDINPGSSSYYGYYGYSSYPYGSYASNLTEFQGQLFFTANDGVTGNELWVSDGTAAGTQLLKDINPVGSSYAYNLTVAGDLFFFTASDAFNGEELWVSDGTAEGTQLLQDINPGNNSSSPIELTVVEDQLFFTADNGTTGRELWSITIPDNIISGDDTDNTLRGTGKADLINGFDGDDIIRGRRDDDILNGGPGGDFIFGQGGADKISGGPGSDVLDGGGGADTFLFGQELLDGQSDTDTIVNFKTQDILDFTGYLSAGGSIEATRVTSGLLSLNLGNEDVVNIFGDRSGLDAAESQIA